ncbi:MAG: FecR domain-containing protein [Polyangiaceae bacterium]|nr:FecR domain-containing protein [Polyangiaceae bacterium]
MSEKTGLCLQVEDNLAEVLDGSASASRFDHIADCDVCRDLRYDAERTAEVVKRAGADFRAPVGFAETLLAKIDAARPNGPTGTAAPVTSVGSRTSTTVASSGEVAGGTARPQSTPAPETAQVITPARPSDLGKALEKPAATVEIASAPTELAPLDAHKTDPSPVRADLSESPAESAKRRTSEARSETPAASNEIADAGRAAGKSTRVEEPVRSAFDKPESTGADRPSGARPTVIAESAPHATGRAVSATVADQSSSHKANDAKGGKGGGKVVPFFRKPAFVAAAAISMAAAAAVAGVVLKNKTNQPQETAVTEAPWSGKVGKIARASADKVGGFEVCSASGNCTAAATDAAVEQGSTLRTDARTRARVALADGTWLALDRDTELTIAAANDRAAKLIRGSIVADVASADKSKPATIATDLGTIEILGTKLQVTAGKDRASVEVARGTVRVLSNAGKSVDVRAGEEATLLEKADPVVASSTSLADVMEWSDQSQEEVDAPVLRGLGELRAKKPGDTKEKDRAVRLSKHSVKVRVVDVVARTEVDETFTNDTDEELEGIFRFPLPPGAQIEGLALEVDGQLVQGAFVDRDKGAAIWRGVIQNAAPKQPKPREEIIWVPGPWRDPALLEWQRGGRFELRIFPIPKRGSRRVVLAYTQTVDQSGGVRRFTYPLAHDTSGTTKIDSFDMDVQVLGADKEIGVTTRGYTLATASSVESAAERRTFHADAFTPSGDLTIEYALPDRDKEVTAWAYRMSATDAALASTTAGTAPSSSAGATNSPPVKASSPQEKAAIEAARTIAGDTSPYVAIAVRPKLPRWQEQKERMHVLIVDSSRSMIGERFARARRLATTIVKEMDRRDSFVVLACDSSCRGIDGAVAPKPMAPGASAAADVEKFLATIEPDGGSDIGTWISSARAAAGSTRDKELRVIYLGDGTPTVGATRASHLEAAAKAAMPAGDGAIVAVALGSDADMTAMTALARGGGGVVVPYVPGQKVSTAALEVLSAAYGVVLRDPEIELPPGLTQVTPSRLDPIRAGGESIIVARMAVDGDVSGQIKLRGRVSGERFEQTYPVKIAPTSSQGNAFVPRLFAAAKIAELERSGGDTAKPMIVELSKRFAVASQFTSLLVLESAAMFKAFGLDRGSVAPSFTGEVAAQSESSDADGEATEEEREAKDSPSDPLSKAKRAAADEFDGPGGGGFGLGASGAAASASPATPAPAATSTAAPPAKQGASSKKPALACSPGDPFCFDDLDSKPSPSSRPRPWTPPRRPLVPMKRVFERRAGFEATNALVADGSTKLAAAETALSAQPDSRDKTVALYALYATMGRLGEAQELTARWASRDALDPDALIARADLAARQGDRDRAIRILGGLADVRPGDKTVQARLADLFDAAQNPVRACAHRVALADLATTDVKAVAAAISCARSVGMSDLAETVRRDLDAKTRDAVEKAITTTVASTTQTVRGDVRVTADWTGGGDVDIALIDSQGKRMSWLGGTNSKVTVSASNATGSSSETLGFLGLGSGSYIIEVSRAAGTDVNVPISGDVTIVMPGGGSRKVHFNLNGARTEIGTVRVFFESKLVPVSGGFGGWPR